MLGQPVYFLTPDVVGVNLKGKLHPTACTATDLVLTVTEMLRKAKVVGKFVEFFGEGAESLSVTDRATIANMAPEYGATMGFFPVDDKTIEYFRGTGRTDAEIDAFEAYFKAQGMFGIPKKGDIDYCAGRSSSTWPTICPSLAGPKRPQDRIDLDKREERRSPSLFTQAGAGERLRQEARGPGKRRTRPTTASTIRTRRRADRRHHLVHQHLEPGRAARRRPARQEGGRAGPDGQAAHQDLARARARASSPST